MLEQLREAGFHVEEEDLVHLSPTRYGHVNPYGRYRFDPDGGLRPEGLRPLRMV